MPRRPLVVTFASATALTTGVLLWGTTVHADQAAPTFSVLNGTVDAGAVLFQAGSSQFPNFDNGAFDNYYPLAHTHLDSSPFTEGTASPADTGPIGGFIASGVAGNPAFSQPQYADDRYPPGNAGGAPSTTGSLPGPFATATAAANLASAQADAANMSLAATGTGAGAVAGAAAAPLPGTGTTTTPDPWAVLWRALTAWRQTYLTAADAARFPASKEDVAGDGVGGLTSSSATTFDPATGVLTGSGEAHAAYASFGSGAVTLNGVHVAVKITNTGSSTTKAVTDDISSAQVGGVPVKIGADGVSVDTQQVPGIGAQLQSADAALNSALSQGGISLLALAPTVTPSTNQLTIEAVGVQVGLDPPPAPGAPQFEARLALGDVFVDNLAVPGTPLSLGTGTGATGVETGPAAALSPIGSNPAAAGSSSGGNPSGSAGPGRPRSELVALVAHKPGWLLGLYLLWQVILLATLASLWWWRRAPSS